MAYWKRDFVFANLFILCAIIIIGSVSGQWLVDDDGCRTPDRGSGECIVVNDCKPIIDYLRSHKRPYPQKVLTRLNAYTCGYEGSRVKVCCPPNPLPEENVVTEKLTPPDVSNHRNIGLLPTNCGYLDSTDRIINGEDANLMEFPWMALISYSTATGPDFKCGGTIISKNYILTAAHCITNIQNRLLGVRVGEHSIKSTQDCEKQLDGSTKCAPPVQDVAIQQVIPHPQYNRQPFSSDIGLLRVSTIDLSRENARPVCLPTGDLRTAKYNNIIVTGWGVTGTGKPSDILQKVTLPVTSSADCQRVYLNHNITLDHRQLCAGGKDNKDSCPGDSGGPMQVAGYLNEEVKYIQQGIVSFGPRFCGLAGYSGVYTLVPYYMDWILDNMKP